MLLLSLDELLKMRIPSLRYFLDILCRRRGLVGRTLFGGVSHRGRKRESGCCERRMKMRALGVFFGGKNATSSRLTWKLLFVAYLKFYNGLCSHMRARLS